MIIGKKYKENDGGNPDKRDESLERRNKQDYTKG